MYLSHALVLTSSARDLPREMNMQHISGLAEGLTLAVLEGSGD